MEQLNLLGMSAEALEKLIADAKKARKQVAKPKTPAQLAEADAAPLIIQLQGIADRHGLNVSVRFGQFGGNGLRVKSVDVDKRVLEEAGKREGSFSKTDMAKVTGFSANQINASFARLAEAKKLVDTGKDPNHSGKGIAASLWTLAAVGGKKPAKK
jgi:hypothetical protein